MSWFYRIVGAVCFALLGKTAIDLGLSLSNTWVHIAGFSAAGGISWILAGLLILFVPNKWSPKWDHWFMISVGAGGLTGLIAGVIALVIFPMTFIGATVLWLIVIWSFIGTTIGAVNLRQLKRELRLPRNREDNGW